MSKLETIPAEEGAALLPQKAQSTGIRRVVAVSAMVSFVIGVLAATAVHSGFDLNVGDGGISITQTNHVSGGGFCYKKN